MPLPRFLLEEAKARAKMKGAKPVAQRAVQTNLMQQQGSGARGKILGQRIGFAAPLPTSGVWLTGQHELLNSINLVPNAVAVATAMLKLT